MLTKFKYFASKSKIVIIVYSIYDNWRNKRRFKAGQTVTSSGSTHEKMSLTEIINYVNQVFGDYLTYSNITTSMLRNKRILGLLLQRLVFFSEIYIDVKSIHVNKRWKRGSKFID
ncbi:MAG: hypothetical protein K8F52_07195 [Candidatus Scalindua rubra]|nr:hypothetical protein [Candidatus Scalindua rubra]